MTAVGLQELGKFSPYEWMTAFAGLARCLPDEARRVGQYILDRLVSAAEGYGAYAPKKLDTVKRLLAKGVVADDRCGIRWCGHPAQEGQRI